MPGRSGRADFTVIRAAAPPKVSDLPKGQNLSGKRLLAPERSIGALREFRQARHEAASKLVERLGFNALPGFSMFPAVEGEEKGRPATNVELKVAQREEKYLCDWIARELMLKNPQLTFKCARKEAVAELSKDCTALLNNKSWNKEVTRFKHKGREFISTLVPAAQMKMDGGDKDIFPISYNGKGICSSSTRETQHAVNLWISEISTQEGSKEKVLSRVVRHGILSPYGLEKDSVGRSDGAKNRAIEVVTAALFTKPELLKKALAGGEVPLRLVSTSLVTGGLSNEHDMLDDQMAAWSQLTETQPLVLSVVDASGARCDVKVRLEVAALNFGVNELALQLGFGQSQADAFNVGALRQLLGDDLSEGKEPGGWVADYLKSEPAPTAKSAERVRILSDQLRAIWASKAHHSDGGEPYKASQRIESLAYEIGAVPCLNCKSGKDRTEMADAEGKFAAVRWYQGAEPNVPGSKLTEDDQQLLRKILLNDGGIKVQKYNTGAPGNKVMKKLPFLNLSFLKRIGDSNVWDRLQGLSRLVKS
ncbi:inositol phosphate phosphatase SopB [Pseudomonas chlororaphis subsp. aurantiaca]|uniref:inositol phosphate phosphatase SopB n=1 Tax=Pseudomonas chlororaphis TaxID=587753 RepID=UPI0027DC84AB|nr:inositol phosphate phosphatase SopB [Pseudomonas chlororaphis]WMI97584.1 inositol phosphate phosphatase SopB [Pseudomonas chlororaphis subsp. aurantiaca]